MISLYDVLKANKGLPVGEPIACHWGRKLGGGAAGYGELTGTPPLTFTANGRNLVTIGKPGYAGTDAVLEEETLAHPEQWYQFYRFFGDSTK